ncbi:YcnI family copper-binding membrane protein [Gorillibacterium sp. sgz5001074]|uniref:YcnI family copper-binding membrane protein n=1 Tax=Gorillibacterium sp. sgz5001074 TaxID=3446695 RepID=UPI003F67FFAE
MKMLRKVIPLMFLSMVWFAGLASAHVVVYPKETTQGTYEMFTLRVPTEKEVPTTKVEVIIPADVTVSRFEPKPGWQYELTKDASGKITNVRWTATGEGLSSTEFGDFHMQGKVGDKATQLVWKAIQTYKDGSTVEWTGAADAKTPASVTTVKPGTAGGTDSHGQTAAAPAAGDSKEESKTPLYLSIAALALGVVAVLLALFRRAK